MASREDIQLAKVLIKQHFGRQLANFVEIMLKSGAMTYRQISTNSEVHKISRKGKVIKSMLAVLIQHELVDFDGALVAPENDDIDIAMCKTADLVLLAPLKYRIVLKNVLRILKFPTILADSGDMSPVGRDIMLHVLTNGKIQASHIMAKLFDKMLAAKYGPTIPVDFKVIKQQFIFLVENHFLTSHVLNPNDHNTYKPKVNQTDLCNNLASTLHHLKSIHQEHLFQASVGPIKQPEPPKPSNIKAEYHSDGEDQNPSHATAPITLVSRLAQPGPPPALPDDNIFWSCNFDQWNRLYKRNLVGAAVEARFDSRAANIAELFMPLHSFNQTSEKDKQKTTFYYPLSEIKKSEDYKRTIQAWLPTGGGVTKRDADSLLHEYIDILSKDRINPGAHVKKDQRSWLIVDTESSNLGDPRCSLNLFNIIQRLVLEQLVFVARQYYGPDATRIIRILHEKNYTDKPTLAKLTMFDEKYLTAMLYKLMSINLITTQPLPKRPGGHCDYSVLLSQLVFGLDLEAVARFMIENAKGAYWRLDARQHVEGESNRKLMQKKAEIDAINRKMQHDPSSMPEHSLSPDEVRRYDIYRRNRDQIRRQRQLLGKDIAVLEEYLKLVPRSNDENPS